MKDKKTSIKGEALNRSQCNNQKKKDKWTDIERHLMKVILETRRAH